MGGHIDDGLSHLDLTLLPQRHNEDVVLVEERDS